MTNIFSSRVDWRCKNLSWLSLSTSILSLVASTPLRSLWRWQTLSTSFWKSKGGRGLKRFQRFRRKIKKNLLMASKVPQSLLRKALNAITLTARPRRWGLILVISLLALQVARQSTSIVLKTFILINQHTYSWPLIIPFQHLRVH